MKIFRKSLLISTAFVLSATLFSCSDSSPDQPSVTDDTGISPQSITFEWQSIYQDKLAEFKNSADFSADIDSGSRFDLFDITGDKTPELIISPNNSGQTPCRIYSCSNGELTELGSTGNCGTFLYLPDLQLIKDEYQGNGFVIGKYVEYQNGSFNTVISYSDNSTSLYSGATITYEIDGQQVLLPEYESALKPYSNAESITAGRKYTFGDNALDYAIKCSESWGAVLQPNQREAYKSTLTDYLSDDSGNSYAFELCDLNSDNSPELIISSGNEKENGCEVYYYENDELQHIDGIFGEYGKFTFDTEQFVLSAGVTRWSINNSNFSASEYKHSENLAEIGRKYLLTETNINLALN
ncbi:MAG: hypothetical protein NC340_09885 [Ruminococcus flavefaciens]|nr:hypothetical protein [Ruminococcus flavefaciens]MCM1231387.1 hypothetical protein [Ruminococcus flavefaciens]